MSKRDYFEKDDLVLRKLSWLLAFTFLLFGAALWGRLIFLRSSVLEVVFLDVGQGDAILIQKGGTQILLDGGRDGKVLLEKLGAYIPFWDRTIEAMIATHPDQDHIAGLIDVFESYEVEAVLASEAKSDSRTFEAFTKALEAEKSKVLGNEQAPRFVLGSGCFLEVFPSSQEGDGDSNSQSVAVRLVAGQEIFLMLGDLPAKQEDSLVKREDVKADVLKVSHHGSKYSTSELFLEQIRARDAVISVGARNSYGHPDAEILSRLKKRGMRVLRTDERGDVIYKCAPFGKGCSVKTQK